MDRPRSIGLPVPCLDPNRLRRRTRLNRFLAGLRESHADRPDPRRASPGRATAAGGRAPSAPSRLDPGRGRRGHVRGHGAGAAAALAAARRPAVRGQRALPAAERGERRPDRVAGLPDRAPAREARVRAARRLARLAPEPEVRVRALPGGDGSHGGPLLRLVDVHQGLVRLVVHAPDGPGRRAEPRGGRRLLCGVVEQRPALRRAALEPDHPAAHAARGRAPGAEGLQPGEAGRGQPGRGAGVPVRRGRAARDPDQPRDSLCRVREA